MNLSEIYEPTAPGYRDEREDHSAFRASDQRAWRSHITLDRLNKLRKMNDVRKLEHEKKLDSVSSQYKPPAAAGGGLGL